MYKYLSGGRRNAGGWTPADLASLIAWWDASDTATITESGGAVSQWDDKSGNGRHLIQPTGTDQPTTGTRTLNSLNVLDFDGVNDDMYRVMTIAQIYNICAVIELDANDNNQNISSGQGNDAGNFRIDASSNNLVFWSGAGPDVLGGITGEVGNGKVYLARGNGASGIIEYNKGALTSSGNVGSTSWGTTCWIGSRFGSSNHLEGKIAEVIVFGGTDATEKTNLYSYLGTKWAV